MARNSVKVEIYGAQYTLKADADDVGKVHEVAELVDRTMRDIRDKTGYGSPANLAILAALNIADELYEHKKRIDDTARELVSKLDKALGR
jgi:cell division protein ZapA